MTKVRVSFTVDKDIERRFHSMCWSYDENKSKVIEELMLEYVERAETLEEEEVGIEIKD